MLYLIRPSSARSGRPGFYVAAADRDDTLAKARQLARLGVQDIEIVDKTGRAFTVAEFEREGVRARQAA
jgi:ribosomal protein L13E